MDNKSFRSWFEGFVEGIGDKVPTTKQWALIKKRVSEIDGQPVTEKVFIERYWSYPYPWYVYPVYPSPSIPVTPIWSGVGISGGGLGGASNLNTCNDGHSITYGEGSYTSGVTLGGGCELAPSRFESTVAMFSLGQADAQQLVM